jgi:hypothetical protein
MYVHAAISVFNNAFPKNKKEVSPVVALGILFGILGSFCCA